MAGSPRRIQLHVVSWAMPEISLAVQQVLSLVRAVMRNFQLVKRQRYESRLRVMRVEIHDGYQKVRAVLRLLAVANELVIVSGVKL